MVFEKLKKYGEMVMFSHTLFSLPFGMLAMVWAADGLPKIWVFVWILVALFGARNGANAFNRIADRHIDKKNDRTKDRHLATGEIKLYEAYGVPQEYLIPLRTIRAGHRAILFHVIFPAALPEMFTSVRIGLATGISVLFFAETFGTMWGLGFYIMDMWMRLDYEQMYAGILFLGFLGLSSVMLVNRLQKHVCPWVNG